MDFLLDEYLYRWLPFDVSDEVRKKVASMGMDLLRVSATFLKTSFCAPFFFLLLDFVLFPVLNLFLGI